MVPSPAAPVSSTPAAPDSALAALREATRMRHERIDALMDLRRLHEPARYGRVLQVFESFLATWEEAVAAALPVETQKWLQRRSRRPFAQQDLRVLALPSLARPDLALDLATPAAAWGSLYVMEGSALGSQVITRALASAGLHPATGAAYFHGWGVATGPMWQEFRARLGAEPAEPAWIASACQAACRTFDALTTLLESALDERLAAA